MKRKKKSTEAGECGGSKVSDNTFFFRFFLHAFTCSPWLWFRNMSYSTNVHVLHRGGVEETSDESHPGGFEVGEASALVGHWLGEKGLELTRRFQKNMQCIIIFLFIFRCISMYISFTRHSPKLNGTKTFRFSHTTGSVLNPMLKFVKVFWEIYRFWNQVFKQVFCTSSIKA